MRDEPVFRTPNDVERALFSRLVSLEFPGRDLVARQLTNSLVREIDQCWILKFGSLELKTTERTPAPANFIAPVEAEIEDTDGVLIHLQLLFSGGFVKELLVFKDDDSDVVAVPDVSNARIKTSKQEKASTE